MAGEVADVELVIANEMVGVVPDGIHTRVELAQISASQITTIPTRRLYGVRWCILNRSRRFDLSGIECRVIKLGLSTNLWKR